mmetsp:Transcript_33650/g.51924  ORF Transcript_33650/g.51924 Transcript_33650/m.51924 type:complete len:107 (-) Transcript_33650:1133-1453(-)|eukprot:CAMPEP_0170490564 /NCGR_PEP_ID=MMETSP0208-20121228/8729_1 /TAXON_ID=197538 /ORGANISM="Strombidium inclinatum, Strain S3" /LENGTH=106 /DNA_ID=CAMNT_0010765991 /DNA_START=1054 /DNA_END=1374 /DNA_ORIENTATION=+
MREYSLFRLQRLLLRRPFLMCDVNLHNNPNDVNEWLTKIALCDKLFVIDANLKAATFMKAISSIDPRAAVGKFSEVWIQFARYYEENPMLMEEDSEGNLENANLVF